MNDNRNDLEIIRGLRCSATPGGAESCAGCPWLLREELPAQMRGKYGVDGFAESCSTDLIALAAADRLEELVAENEHLRI